MTDASVPPGPSPEPQPPKSRSGAFVAIGAGGVVVLAALVTLVLIVALGVVHSAGFSTGLARQSLLTQKDLAGLRGVEIATGSDGAVRSHSLEQYIHGNPTDDSHTVAPAKCADNLEGWMAWKALDTPAYRGWKTDTIYEASNIVVDATTNYENGLQEVRHFVNTAAATAFVSAQRGWYRDCAHTSYSDPEDPGDDSSFTFAPIPLDLGLDSVVEGSTDTGQSLPPHLIDVYLRNQNIVYVTELVSTSSPRQGMDPVSLSIVKAAAKKLRSLP
jgi:hypothetical protein